MSFGGFRNANVWAWPQRERRYESCRVLRAVRLGRSVVLTNSAMRVRVSGNQGLIATSPSPGRIRTNQDEDFHRPGVKMGSHWYSDPMEATIDSGGRILLPKSLRDALGLTPGSTVDISAYGSGVQVTPGGRTARLERDAEGRLVATSDSVVTDEDMFAVIDAGRR